MANLNKILKGEIREISRRETRAVNASLRRDVAALKREIVELRRRCRELARGKAPKSAPVKAAGVQLKEVSEAEVARARPTSGMVCTLRAKWGITQAEFAKVLGVSTISVSNWERKEGRIAMRSRPTRRLLEVRHLGKRDVQRLLEG